MLSIMSDLPPHVLGIRATGAVTKQDFDDVLKPALDALFKRTGKINYLLLLETTVSNFTLGAWVDDLVIGLKHFTHWNRIAIVTNEKLVKNFSDVFGFVVPGESRGFTLSQLATAKEWVSAG
ncbi:MAG: STAS/SEC14 domain-containing protein [Ferruginibacter sp.]|nr:STAS/SEC14 domain-containing protein [Ferruginibacter sp.]